MSVVTTCPACATVAGTIPPPGGVVVENRYWMMQWTAQILHLVLQPARGHFGIYAEEIKHLHVHEFPRMPKMPPGNIRNLWINAWMDILHASGLKKSYSDQVVSEYAGKLRQAYQELAKYNPMDDAV